MMATLKSVGGFCKKMVIDKQQAIPKRIVFIFGSHFSI